ncbi:hypothetical protein BJ166DRAFT_594861 [Pestalotiopsis sp. NC0098]|nr:hypothetical protein BJ166DRAFT_594861 [Pestalotiopsis sp. NC0098]
MDNNFEDVDLDSDIVQSDWDSCGSNKSDYEWEYVDDKRVDTTRGREGATRTFPISLKKDRSEALLHSGAVDSEDENDLLTQESFFNAGNHQQQSWNSTEQEHSTTNQQAFAEILEVYEYYQPLLPEVQPYAPLRFGAPSEKPAKEPRHTNQSAEREHSSQSIGEWCEQITQGTCASDVQPRPSRLPASSQYPPEESSTEPQAAVVVLDRNHEPQNRAQFDQWFEESFGRPSHEQHQERSQFEQWYDEGSGRPSHEQHQDRTQFEQWYEEGSGPQPQREYIPNVLSGHSRHPPSSDLPLKTLKWVPSHLRQKGKGSRSGKENVPPKDSEPSRRRPATRRGHRPEYLERETSQEGRHHGDLSVQEPILPYGMQELLDALPEAPTIEAESPQPSDEMREQNAPPTPRLAPRVRPDTPPGQDLLTSPEVSAGDETLHAYATVEFSNTPADFQRWVEERDRERNRVHRRRIKKRYPRPQLPSTAVDTTSASGTGESRRSAVSSDTVQAENRLASLPRRPFSYQRMS